MKRTKFITQPGKEWLKELAKREELEKQKQAQEKYEAMYRLKTRTDTSAFIKNTSYKIDSNILKFSDTTSTGTPEYIKQYRGISNTSKW